MKFVYIVAAVVIIGGIAVLLTNKNAEAPSEAMDDTAISDTMPTMDANDTDEMQVVETESEGMSAEEHMASMDSGVAPDVKMFNVSGSNFKFDIEEIRVREGDTVMIHFTAADGFHDWVVDEFGAATDQVRPGTPTSVTFVADKAGTYEYYCSVGNHKDMGMVGKLIVE